MDQKTFENLLVKVGEQTSKTMTETMNDFMEKSLIPKMEEISVKNARKVVERMLIERSVRGRDITGLDDEQKKAFAKQVQSVFRGNREGALVVKAERGLDRRAGQPRRLPG